jgi:hypothetical protein
MTLSITLLVVKLSAVRLGVTFFYYYAECRYAECRYAVSLCCIVMLCRYAVSLCCVVMLCRYAECRYAECRCKP